VKIVLTMSPESAQALLNLLAKLPIEQSYSVWSEIKAVTERQIQDHLKNEHQ
jgi:hypothetical protein